MVNSKATDMSIVSQSNQMLNETYNHLFVEKLPTNDYLASLQKIKKEQKFMQGDKILKYPYHQSPGGGGFFEVKPPEKVAKPRRRRMQTANTYKPKTLLEQINETAQEDLDVTLLCS